MDDRRFSHDDVVALVTRAYALQLLYEKRKDEGLLGIVERELSTDDRIPFQAVYSIATETGVERKYVDRVMETLQPSKRKMRADAAALGAELSKGLSDRIYAHELHGLFDAYKNRIYEALASVYGAEAIFVETDGSCFSWGGFLNAGVFFYQVTRYELPGNLLSLSRPRHKTQKKELGSVVFSQDLGIDNHQNVQINLSDPSFASVTKQVLRELRGELEKFERSYFRFVLDYKVIQHYRID